ncbi:hypothetical protein FQR65_LT03809 [Abscondita terminalis]|nr:hypothetical protein FQR65_LT03809 [Abscondita terminalis]
MAKLGAYYGLCPLIDQRNLLGVSEDSEPGHVIVTLGRNIAIKYRISDQKQIHSWRTKDKFSSPVIYDKDANKYVAVFNHIYVRTWDGNEEYVDKLKKFKFNKPIQTLVSCNDKVFLIFKNGIIALLKDGIDNRKDISSDGLFHENINGNFEVLTAYLNEHLYIGLIMNFDNKNVFVVKCLVDDQESLHKIELTRDNSKLTLKGHILCHIEHSQEVHLLTLWSDGKLYSYNLDFNNENRQANLFASFETLSCKDPVTMAYLNQHYVAMYGADCNEEGAALILYNTQFKVFQSKQTLKLFTSGAKLWKIENNLLFCCGQSLGVMPFYLETEQLSALVGSHRVALIDSDPDVVLVEEMEEADWNVLKVKSQERSIPSNIKSQVLDLSQQGLSESTMCGVILPGYIENCDVEAIMSCLNYFYDIPELYLAELLCFCLTVDDQCFSLVNLIDCDLPQSLRQKNRCALIDKILMSSFSGTLILPHLHKKLDLSCTLLLLKYIFYLMSGNGKRSNDVVEFESKLMDWCCLLLDANYQKFLLSKDEQILELLKNFSELVTKYSNCLENFNEIVPVLYDIKRGKKTIKNKQLSSLQYSVEKLSLY